MIKLVSLANLKSGSFSFLRTRTAAPYHGYASTTFFCGRGQRARTCMPKRPPKVSGSEDGPLHLALRLLRPTIGPVQLTTHAKNRLRLIQRRAQGLSERRLLKAIESANVIGEDLKGNRKVSVLVDGVLLVGVVDEARQIVITIWREE